MDNQATGVPPAVSFAQPKTGWAGLKENFISDLTAGFMVFLLALPLSLGIARASGFPPAMGVLTAMVGGLVASWLKVSALTIKGPAAGLITVCSAAMAEFGGGEDAWKTVCGIIVVMAVLQVVLGVFKFGTLSDFFPHAAVHGMLAAIGIIIISKQIPVLLGVDPSLYKGETPLQLLADIPRFFQNPDFHLEVIGIVGLFILFAISMLRFSWAKKIPAPVLVLVVALTLSIHWHLSSEGPTYGLVKIGNFWSGVGMKADFSKALSFPFWKYVLMFLFVSSLESLLTVKAVDGLDPFRRESDYNGDLKAQGTANLVSGLLGGLPMISEVVRSSANVGFGARTKWANFFHGCFLLLAMLLLVPLIEFIPNSALAAMLIFAGYRLASPKEFVHMYQIGKEQLLVFIVTIVVTLAEDLLLGVAFGILTKIVFQIYHGVPFVRFFSLKMNQAEASDGSIVITIEDAAVFLSIVSLKKTLAQLPLHKALIINLSKTKLVDYSFMAFISHFAKESLAKGRRVVIEGLEAHRPFSDYPLATRKLVTSESREVRDV